MLHTGECGEGGFGVKARLFEQFRGTSHWQHCNIRGAEPPLLEDGSPGPGGEGGTVGETGEDGADFEVGCCEEIRCLFM